MGNCYVDTHWLLTVRAMPKKSQVRKPPGRVKEDPQTSAPLVRKWWKRGQYLQQAVHRIGSEWNCSFYIHLNSLIYILRGLLLWSMLRRSTKSFAASFVIPWGKSAYSVAPPCPLFCILVGHSQRVWRDRFLRSARHCVHCETGRPFFRI